MGFNLICNLRVFPQSPEVDLEILKKKIEKTIPSHMELYKIEEEPIAFGLVALNVKILSTDDDKGDITPVEEKIKELEEVSQAEVSDVRRTLG
ncbi:MAG: elongation factor 1-beta [Candidatus Methanofastidiosia archaeon]